MKPEDFALELQKRFAGFGKRIIYDVTARGEDFCEMVYSNTALPSFPLTVTVYSDGTLLSFGNAENITSDVRLDTDETIAAIDDIINDRMIFVLRYANQQKREDGKIADAQIFLVTGEDGDMSEEYKKYIARLQKKPSCLGRLLTTRRGIFRVLSFSGKTNIEIQR